MIELIITHDGRNWTAKNNELSAKGSSLEQLDNNLKNLVRQQGFLDVHEKIDLIMFFDNSTIPQWIRQYSQHYFNRILRVERYPKAAKPQF